MDKLIAFLVKHISLTEDDALVSAIFGVRGYTLDTLFFPDGMPPLTVTILFAACGLLIPKWLKNRMFFVERSLKQIDCLVKQGRFTPQQGEHHKSRLLEKWLESTKGLPPDKEGKQLTQNTDQ